MAKKKALGRGLMALIDDNVKEDVLEKEIGGKNTVSGKRIQELDIKKLQANEEQPRKKFGNMDSLVNSIKEKGVLQPILVRENADYFQIIAGERRYRAAKEAKLKTVPVIQINANEEETMEIALIENIQRENLNPIEEAEGYRLLIDRFGLTQEEASKKVGKDRATISNALRLLSLPEEIRTAIVKQKLTAGHAKVLLSVKDERKQKKLFKKVIDEGLSVRALEQQIVNPKKSKESLKKKKQTKQDVFLKDLENSMEEFFGTKVRIKGNQKNGKIEIEYFNMDDLERIKDLM